MTQASDPLLPSAARLLQAMDQAAQVSALERKHRDEMENLLRGLLDVLDSVAALHDHLRAMQEPDNLRLPVKTAELVGKQLLQRLASVGAEPMLTTGERLDLGAHEVVGTRATATSEEGTILETVSQGFTWRYRVLRRAKVIVHKPADPST